MFLVSFDEFLTISRHYNVFLSEIKTFDFGRFWPILAIFLPFSQGSKRVKEMPQDQVVKGVHTNLKNSEMVKMSSNNPKQSYKVALVPPQSVPGPYRDPLRGSPRGPFGAPGAQWSISNIDPDQLILADFWSLGASLTCFPWTYRLTPYAIDSSHGDYQTPRDGLHRPKGNISPRPRWGGGRWRPPPPAFQTLAKDMSLNRGATHFTLGLRPCFISFFIYIPAPLFQN